MDRNEVRKSKSKMRSYLKRCKDALYGHQQQSEESCTITVHENSSTNTSWYLTEDMDTTTSDAFKMCNTETQLPKGSNQVVVEQEAIDNEIKCINMIQTVPLVVESKV